MLMHRGTREIKTERLILRRFTMNDADDMFNNWAADDEVTKYLTWQSHESVEASREIIAEWIKSYESDRSYNYAMELDGVVIGSISAVSVSDKHLSCEIGYCMSKKYWNRGLMTEALKGLLEFMFLTVGFHRISAVHAAQNPASGRVMQKVGMSYEGTRKDALKYENGEFDNIICYSILEDEWLENQQP